MCSEIYSFWCTLLCFSKCMELCNQHHNQDTVQLLVPPSPKLISFATPLETILPSTINPWHLLVCNLLEFCLLEWIVNGVIKYVIFLLNNVFRIYSYYCMINGLFSFNWETVFQCMHAPVLIFLSPRWRIIWNVSTFASFYTYYIYIIYYQYYKCICGVFNT